MAEKSVTVGIDVAGATLDVTADVNRERGTGPGRTFAYTFLYRSVGARLPA